MGFYELLGLGLLIAFVTAAVLVMRRWFNPLRMRYRIWRLRRPR